MSNRHIPRAERRRMRRRRNMISIGAMILIAAVLIVAVVLILRPHADAPAAVEATSIPEITSTPLPTAVPTVTATAEPTPEPTATPAPTFEPGSIPNVVSFYRPKGKSYSPRVKLGDEYAAKWKKGEDIGSFEVIASDQDELPGDFFGDIFGAVWKSFPESDHCKIGYTLRYTLKDGGEIQYTMLSPKHIEHTEYIECWLYDDYHREPHQSYSHIKTMNKDTLMTSIKLTCGSKIADVDEIWLTAFVCASLDEFDADRNYIGDTSVTLHIVRE